VARTLLNLTVCIPLPRLQVALSLHTAEAALHNCYRDYAQVNAAQLAALI
jgi:hypothetical protein